MSRLWTILFGLLALAAVIFLAIYEPLTRRSRDAERSPYVLDIDPAKITEIHIISGDETIELKRRGNVWKLGPKIKDRADTQLVRQLLMAASNLRAFDRMAASEFKSSDDLSDFSLRNPKRRIEFIGDDKTTLLLGKDAVSEDRIYVRRDDSRAVSIVSDDILKLAFRNVSDFRDRKLSDLSPDQIDRFVLRLPGGEIELTREAQGWAITKPLHAVADTKKVEEYLGKLLGLKITDFVATDSGDLSTYGITEGQNEISFYAEGNDRHQTLRFGSAPPEQLGSIFAQFTARDSIYHIPSDSSDLLKATPDTFRDRSLLPLNLDMVDVIRVQTPQGKFSLSRAGEGWEIHQDGQASPANDSTVKKFVETLSKTEAASYTPLSGNSAAYGLDAPAAQIEFLSVLSENTPEARAGENTIASLTIGKTDAGLTNVRVGDSPEACKVPEGALKALPLDPAAFK